MILSVLETSGSAESKCVDMSESLVVGRFVCGLHLVFGSQETTLKPGEQVKDQQRDQVSWQLYDKAPREHTCVRITRGAVAVPVCFGESCDSPSYVSARCCDREPDAQWQLPPRSHGPAQSHCR
ncbi:Hypothetical protein SMAX5B_020203 [Scophthalmus maximus]|uniref:Uncharacterized protein n=1 Tax=Scophthalmus maximus TaxID=52904 RepID=A0A2U9CM19_SCOMX|nr:Hypothetical protein SMAX5B_020203 [Scophthalmus maximus]KAF0025326.1 hypothetical protein F2P81_022207 [Scophthalmus maximus]